MSDMEFAQQINQLSIGEIRLLEIVVKDMIQRGEANNRIQCFYEILKMITKNA